MQFAALCWERRRPVGFSFCAGGAAGAPGVGVCTGRIPLSADIGALDTLYQIAGLYNGRGFCILMIGVPPWRVGHIPADAVT